MKIDVAARFVRNADMLEGLLALNIVFNYAYFEHDYMIIHVVNVGN